MSLSNRVVLLDGGMGQPRLKSFSILIAKMTGLVGVTNLVRMAVVEVRYVW